MGKKLPQSGCRYRKREIALEVRPIFSREEATWDSLMARYHYLGFRQLVGESLKYVGFLDKRPVGLVGWGAAAFKNTHRDRWIGWSAEIQWQRLKYIANNMRFLILPGTRIKNLASKILSENVKRLSGDWDAVFGHPIVLAETFIDPRRFRGTCYLAAGWIRLGDTRGYGRSGRRYYFHGNPKTIFVRPLCRNARYLLSAPFTPPKLKGNQEEFSMDLNRINLDGDKGLFERLSQITDPRKPRGVRHNHLSVLSIGICACLSGCRSYVAIGEWASNLTQPLLKRFRCRRNEYTGDYIPPSEPTIRRILQRIDPNEVDQMINEWLSGCGGESIAVDGKSLRGSRSKEKKAVHLLAALVHNEGVVVGQKEVDGKSNEITAFKPLLEEIDIKGKVITADAMHAQVGHATYIKKRGGDYIFVVKNNQSSTLEAIKDLDDDFFSL